MFDKADIQYLEASRKAGEACLKTFTPQMGKRYTNGRNFDRGAGQHRDVSMLSPYVRRRLVLEEDLVNSALKAHGLEDAFPHASSAEAVLGAAPNTAIPRAQRCPKQQPSQELKLQPRPRHELSR